MIRSIKTKLTRFNIGEYFFYTTCILALFPILSFGLRSIVIIIWVTLGLINHVYKEKQEYNKNELKNLIFCVFPFIYLCISLLYSENYDLGIKRLIQMLPFLIFPIIFYLNRQSFDKKSVNMMMWVFSVSVILLIFIQIAYSLFNKDLLLSDLTKEEIIRNRLLNEKFLDKEVINEIKVKRFRNFLLELTDTHFTYQGLWSVFSIFFFVKQGAFFIKQKRKIGIICLLAALILVAWLFLISSRMPILALIIAFLCSIFILSQIKAKSKLVFSLLTILILMFGYYFFTPFKVRINEVINFKFELPQEKEDSYNHTSVNVRNGIYTCSYMIGKENFFLGVGVGDSQNELNKCYNKLEAEIYTWTDYNTHNQYLFFLICSGVFGLLFFLGLLYILWKSALKSKNLMYLCFIVVICLVSMTENILSRSDGVMFFAFFSSLFFFNLKKE